MENEVVTVNEIVPAKPLVGHSGTLVSNLIKLESALDSASEKIKSNIERSGRIKIYIHSIERKKQQRLS